MPRILLTLALCLSLATPLRAVADPPSAAAPAAVLDEVLVTGEQPGPGLWRVSRGEHELWILGTFDPLPRKMSWRAEEATEVIGRSQAVLAPPSVDLDVGFFKGLTLVPALLHARKNSDGDKLVEVLPPELYPRWSALKARYIGRDAGVEKYRPLFAAGELYRRALDKSGLVSADSVWQTVRKLARKQGVPVQAITLEVKLDDPKGAIRQFEQTPREAEITCLRTTIERLETDLDAMRQRANLWARGDVAGLRALPYPDQRAACFEAATSVPALRERAAQIRADLIETWLRAADAALAKNRCTFAVLPIGEATKPDGWIARLRERGYEVEEP